MSRIGIVPGESGVLASSPKNLIIGTSISDASTPPAAIVKAMRGPMM